jgi:RNA-directed DNA polymerase
MGYIRDGFDFLGCHISPSGVSPSRASATRLLDAIRLVIREGKASIRELRSPTITRRAEDGYLQSLLLIDKKARGWGDALRFCGDRLRFSLVDREIDVMLAEYRNWLGAQLAHADPMARRRMTGIALLRDTPVERCSLDRLSDSASKASGVGRNPPRPIQASRIAAQTE